VAPAVIELAGKDAVEGIPFGHLGRPDVAVDRRDAAVGRHVVEPDPVGLDPRGGVAEIQEGPRGAHGPEGSRGHHVDLPGRLHVAVALDDVDHLLGRHDDGLALPDLLVDLGDGLLDFEGLHHSALFGLSCLSSLSKTLSLTKVSGIRWQVTGQKEGSAACCLHFLIS